MTDTIFLTGVVATSPRHVTTNEGLAITSFRFASSQRRFDRALSKWVDGETNWFTVSAFRTLATHVAGSVVKGDRVVVTGRLRVRDWENSDRSGTNVEIEADALGHDLTWGTSVYTRHIAVAAVDASDSWDETSVASLGDEADSEAKDDAQAKDEAQEFSGKKVVAAA